ncbi:hypothetical protein [Chitinophaga arvensicola]|uniref:Chain length determinant protein n=1 Tax=Chitinophaga arvensicola TaxID=29529 RepID=A0A1I0NPV7_9BACT|nr:hypothetical protein [Chitinophaga arvensicola]SEW03588.1 hypothetical protein SAMN04488122_0309 [Chitinophaga arvensicola]
MEENINSLKDVNDDISLKIILKNSVGFTKYLLSKWKVIFLLGFLGAGIGLGLAFIIKTKYKAELTFVLEESNSGSLGSYLGLASQLGFDFGSGNSSGIFQGDNIMEFLKSRLIIQKSLLSEINIEGKRMTQVEWYIEFNKLRDGWKKKAELQNIHFPLNLDRSKFTLQQDSILDVVFRKITDNNLKIERPDKKLNFILVKCLSKDEVFSKVFVERLVNEAVSFYIDTKTKRIKGNVDRLQLQADSIELLLNRKTRAAAVVQDLNFNAARQQANVATELASRDKLILQTMYTEVVKNLELSKITMAQETPVIQIVDKPILPLPQDKLGKLKGLILGGIIGGFLAIGALLTGKLYKFILS